VRIKSEGYRCMPAPHAFYSKMLAERTAFRNIFFSFFFHFEHQSSKCKCKRNALRAPQLACHVEQFFPSVFCEVIGMCESLKPGAVIQKSQLQISHPKPSLVYNPFDDVDSENHCFVNSSSFSWFRTCSESEDHLQYEYL